MTQPMRTDTARLAQETSTFEGLVGQLNTEKQTMDTIGNSMLSNLQGETGRATQGAFQRADAALQDLTTEANHIIENLHSSRGSYDAADQDHQAAMSGQMGF
jgi:WXG100 family type VII secretion target